MSICNSCKLKIKGYVYKRNGKLLCGKCWSKDDTPKKKRHK
jgi:hypothetical protein